LLFPLFLGSLSLFVVASTVLPQSLNQLDLPGTTSEAEYGKNSIIHGWICMNKGSSENHLMWQPIIFPRSCAAGTKI
jgi:hypothetical protein